MALRTRLSLAFICTVLVPVLAGAIVVLIAVPRVLHSQIANRLRTAGVGVTNVLSAKCTEAAQAAQLLGVEVATLGPAAAVNHMVASNAVGYAVVAGPGDAGTTARMRPPTSSALAADADAVARVCCCAAAAFNVLETTLPCVTSVTADRPTMPELRLPAVVAPTGHATATCVSAGLPAIANGALLEIAKLPFCKPGAQLFNKAGDGVLVPGAPGSDPALATIVSPGPATTA